MFMRTLAFLALCSFVATAAISVESRTGHRPSRSADPQVNIEYRFQESVSLHEPAVVLFSVHNGFSEPITLTLGAQSRQFFQFSLTTPDGQTLQSYRNPGEDVDLVTIGSGKVEVAPGAEYEQRLLMNQWFQFNTPGTYFLTSQLTTSIDVAGDASLPPQSQTIRLVIRPRDAARLDRVCAELAKQVLMAKGVEPEQEPALKLSYVNDPIAVPYLAQVLSHHMFNYHLAILGLERIGNEAAVQVLLSTLGDNYGDMAELARQALTRMQDRIPTPALKETVRRALASTPSR